MSISKKIKIEVGLKFNGLCAYTGKPLDDKWQVDHIEPIVRFKRYENMRFIGYEGNPNEPENLIPAIRIINHYKRSHNLESFRRSMLNFHIRLGKLPKKTMVKATERRISYMNEVAELFGITTEKPFSGIFYFESLKQIHNGK